MTRPNWDEYFLRIAKDVSARSNCSRRQIGAVLVRDTQIMMTGYNGTPKNYLDCSDGGCERCASTIGTMSNYSTCLCVHAEINAIVLSARHGVKTENCIMYCTCRPCIECMKAIIQAGVIKVVYIEEHIYPDEEIERVFQNFISNCNVELVKYGD